MERGSIPSLTDARGLAIILVLTAHFGGSVFSDATLVFLANAGVILFFVLSGFLIERTLAGEASPWAYGIRRAGRILPAYWLSIFVIAAIDPEAWGAPQIAANLSFLAPAFGIERMSGYYWTLYIECFFYALAFFIVRWGRAWDASLCIVVAALAIWTYGGIGSGAFYYVAFCFCGAQIGAWSRGALSTPRIITSFVAVTGGAAIVFPSLSVSLAFALSASLIVRLLRVERGTAFLGFFGKISYSLYLFHGIVAVELIKLDLPPSVLWPLATVASVALAVIIHRAVEIPGIAGAKLLATKAALWRSKTPS